MNKPIHYCLLVLMFSISHLAFADKVCLKSTLAGKKIMQKTTTVPSTTACPKGMAVIIDTVVLAGAIGATGAAGPSGTPAPVHFIGESYGGGIVFHVDTQGQHGLIAATEDLNGGTQIQWHNGSDFVTNADRDGVNAGGYNTERIVLIQGQGSYAAQLCANYQGGDYGDWYLPSKQELNLMYSNLHATGLSVFAFDSYWSSTEDNANRAWVKSFFNGVQGEVTKSNPHRVRAVRAF